MTTKDEVKTLWKLCFNDSDEFTDLYFKMRYKDEVNRVIREDGKIISALQMIPYPMTFCDEVISTSYISGACTHPDYRKHGAMKRLLKETHRCMYEDGVLLASLIPAEEWLFGYYARSGYAPVFGYAVEQVRVDRLCPAPGCRIEVCEFPGVEHYHYFDSRMHGRRSCIQHPKEDFLVIMADLRLGNGKLLVAWEADKIVGMAFTVMGDDTLYIKELLADTDAVQDTLLYEAAYIYKVQRMDYFIPSSADTLFLGMARVIRAEELLKVFAHKYPASELYIHIDYIALFGGALWCWWNSIISIGTVILIGAAVLAVIGISWISISLENGLTAAGVIAVTALAFNLLLINEVAVPFSSLRSDKEIGLELAQSYRAVDEIGVYGKYSTSAVFYSGKKIIKLVPDEDLANFAPKAYSWKVKNVMPFEGINSFGRRGQLLLVKKNEAGKFLNGSNGKWLVTGEKGGWYILKSA